MARASTGIERGLQISLQRWLLKALTSICCFGSLATAFLDCPPPWGFLLFPCALLALLGTFWWSSCRDIPATSSASGCGTPSPEGGPLGVCPESSASLVCTRILGARLLPFLWGLCKVAWVSAGREVALEGGTQDVGSASTLEGGCCRGPSTLDGVEDLPAAAWGASVTCAPETSNGGLLLRLEGSELFGMKHSTWRWRPPLFFSDWLLTLAIRLALLEGRWGSSAEGSASVLAGSTLSSTRPLAELLEGEALDRLRFWGGGQEPLQHKLFYSMKAAIFLGERLLK